MSLTLFDAIGIVLLGGLIFFEARQEFGRSLADAVAALLALYVASQLTPAAAQVMRLSPDPLVAAGSTFALLFAALLVVGLVLSRFIHQHYRLSADQFDPFFGLIFGLALAVIVGHGFATSIWDYHGHYTPPFMARSWLADELVNLHTLKEAAGSLQQVVQNR